MWTPLRRMSSHLVKRYNYSLQHCVAWNSVLRSQSVQRNFSLHHACNANIDTLLSHAGCETDPGTGAVSPPIHLASTYERDDKLEYFAEHIYGRDSNPTRSLLERTICELEGGTFCAAYSSGQAAATGILLALPRCHLVLPDDLYHGVFVLVSEIFQPWGATFEQVDMTDETAVASALKNAPSDRPTVLWLESPSNPMCKVTDIKNLCELAKSIITTDRLYSVVDATWTTPVLTKPLELGADVVMHSMTKYIGGHSDLTAGVIVSNRSELDSFHTSHVIGGGVCSPFDAWLALRGLRSLGARMKIHCSNAMAVATAMEKEPNVLSTLYPGLASHPQHKLASKQMRNGFGGMLSICVKGGKSGAQTVLRNLKLLKRATSLGGTESLIELRIDSEPNWSKTPDNLLRLSVGLEDPEDITQDLRQALSKIHI